MKTILASALLLWFILSAPAQPPQPPAVAPNRYRTPGLAGIDYMFVWGPELYTSSTLVDVTNNYNVTGAESIIRAWGTNQIITNGITGQLLTVKSMGYGGSVVITNNGTVFDVPGIGTQTNAVYLGPRNSPSNMWTGIE